MKLLHGDCLEVLKGLPAESVDSVITDPPYGNNTTYGFNRRTIINDESPLTGLLALGECYRLLKRNTASYVFLDIKHLHFIRLYVDTYTPYRIRDCLVWNKVHMGLGFGFRKQHELILVLEKGKPRYKNLGLANVLSIARVTTEEHPHKKPVELLSILIRQSTDKGDVILDPFMGSGSTGVACKLEGRHFIGIEREERYVSIAEQRIAATSQEAPPRAA
jgi:site-specific DNA-methyltransferase (adenine-specific)